MFDKGIEVIAIAGGSGYRKDDAYVSYGRHPTEKGYFAIRLKDKDKYWLQGHNCEGLVPEDDGWWVLGSNFIEVEEEN